MAESELIPTLRRFGLDYVVYNPIAGGTSSVPLLPSRPRSEDEEEKEDG